MAKKICVKDVEVEIPYTDMPTVNHYVHTFGERTVISMLDAEICKRWSNLIKGRIKRGQSVEEVVEQLVQEEYKPSCHEVKRLEKLEQRLRKDVGRYNQMKKELGK